MMNESILSLTIPAAIFFGGCIMGRLASKGRCRVGWLIGAGAALLVASYSVSQAVPGYAVSSGMSAAIAFLGGIAAWSIGSCRDAGKPSSVLLLSLASPRELSLSSMLFGWSRKILLGLLTLVAVFLMAQSLPLDLAIWFTGELMLYLEIVSSVWLAARLESLKAALIPVRRWVARCARVDLGPLPNLPIPPVERVTPKFPPAIKLSSWVQLAIRYS